MPTKKKSCEIVQQGIAGPAPDILDAIRAEYWLPASTPAAPDASKDAGQPAQPTHRRPR